MKNARRWRGGRVVREGSDSGRATSRAYHGAGSNAKGSPNDRSPIRCTAFEVQEVAVNSLARTRAQ